jgi:high-affinity Fe2+/Pb2+ permease
MNPKTANTFFWASVISVLLGMAISSPAGSFFFYLLAVVFSLISAISGAKKTRIAAIIILAVSLVLLVVTYPKFDTEMAKYKGRAYKKSSKESSPQQERKQAFFIFSFVCGYAFAAEKPVQAYIEPDEYEIFDAALGEYNPFVLLGKTTVAEKNWISPLLLI